MTAQSEISQAPHMPAAFINAIREEGTKAEAVEWLQKTWNENRLFHRQLNQARKIAWDWAQGVTDAETAIRQLNRMFPIDDSTKSAA